MAASIGVTAVLATVGIVAMSTGTAYAAGASYNGKCGSGYSVIDQGELVNGTVFLAYNRSTGKNCVVTVRNNPGDRYFMDAWVSTEDITSTHGATSVGEDMGAYTTYAGPAYAYAPHKCISWGGFIYPAPRLPPGNEQPTDQFVQSNSHCG